MSPIWTQIRGYPWRLIFLLSTAFGILLFFYKTLDGVARQRRVDWEAAFLEEFTGAYATFLLIPLVMWLVLQFPLGDGAWRKRWPLYLLASLLFGWINTTLIYGFRLMVFAAAGRGVYDYGIMPVRYLMELPQQLMSSPASLWSPITPSTAAWPTAAKYAYRRSSGNWPRRSLKRCDCNCGRIFCSTRSTPFRRWSTKTPVPPTA